MYKLLLATDRHDIQDMFSEISDWESRGFRKPRMASSAQEAIECLENHHVDAIAYRLNAQEEKLLYGSLVQSYPDLPIFRVGESVAQQQAILTDVRVLLNRIHADFSNDGYSIADMMKFTRNEFMRTLLSGGVNDGGEVISRLKLMRFPIAVDKPCVLLDMELPQGDEYLAGRWHYGSERLEVALRNFFGTEHGSISFSVAVVSPQLIRLLACPLEDCGETEGEESLTGQVVDNVREAIERIREYLALEVRLQGVRVLKNVAALASQA